MAISKRLFIYATFLLSCGAVALTITSFATNEWLTGYMVQYDPSAAQADDKIKYGLFSGVYDRYIFIASPITLNLYITCMYAENVCVWSCNLNAEDRVRELRELYENGTGISFLNCGGGTKSMRLEESEDIVQKLDSPRVDRVPDQTFLNAILRMCTIVFLSIALIFALIGAIFAVINSAMNPIELITGIFGLYIWNGIALACDVLVLGLWGGHFGVTLINNVGYTEVILGYLISKDHASLGYSYWCVLGAALLHICNLVLLGVRQFLINKEPETTTIQVIEENNDGALFLY